MFDSGNQMFLSLKWKLVLLLAVAFFFVALGVSWAAYVQQENQLQRERQLSQARNSQELNYQVRAAQNHLIRQAEYLLLLAEENRQALTTERLVAGIEENAARLMLLSSVEQLQIYAPDVGLAYQFGSQEALSLKEVSATALANEQPTVRLSCDTECRILAAIPVLLENGAGTIAIASSIADVVLQMHQASGWEIGIVMETAESTLNDLGDWGLHIAALSNRTQQQPLLQHFARAQAFKGAGQYLLESEDRKYELALLPMPLLDQQRGYWILVTDVTESYREIRNNNIQLLTVTWLSLLICALLLAIVMQPSLNALSAISGALPSLAHHDYDSVRGRLHTGSTVFQRFFKDELGRVVDSAYNLADELERLDKEVQNRTLRLHKSSRELAKQRDFVAGLLDNAQAVIVLQNNSGLCKSINQFGRVLLGQSEMGCINHSFDELFGGLDPLAQDQLQQVYSGLRNICRHETPLISADGNQRTLSWMHSRLTQQNNNDAILSIGMDITEQKVVQHQLQWLANHDPLTELPNRMELQRKLQAVIGQQATGRHSLAVMFCDLDHFKNINDSLGHPAGDKLLKQAAARMRSLVRGQDTVARWGGDEFVVLIEHINQRDDAEQVADKLQQVLAKAYQIQGQEVFLSVSLGIAIYPDHGLDATTLIKHADVAMYKAKADGRKQYVIYSPEQSAMYEERLSLDMDLRYALERDELVLYYQPQLLADGVTVVGVEALLRWQHPRQGMIPPDRFIPLAEESGQIVEIGEWVMREACQQLLRWEHRGIRDIRMSVNLAGPQIMDPHLLTRVECIFNELALPASALELEITESFIMSRPESTIAKLQQLKDLGITLSIDDFGTGYSSLSYLKKLPIDKLKIDKSFVFDIGRYADDEAIAKAIIALGHSLNLTVIAEGVEDQSHVEFLRENGCDELQGFHFSRPLPEQECTLFLQRNLPLPLTKQSI